MWAWIGFVLFLMVMLAVDLGIFHRRSHTVSMREAVGWSIVWVVISLLFGGGVLVWYDWELGVEFFTAYVIEKSLSVDNLFVFVLIFSYFAVPAAYQHRVLFWGIIGALLMRAILIATGVALLEQFHWIIYLFGAFLVFTGIRMFGHDDIQIEPEQNPVVRAARRIMPITADFEGDRFFVRHNNALLATPLLLVLLMVETTDLIFAVDSIPAVLAITEDPFIAFTSNALAVLGLRALYFVLAGVVEQFIYLKQGLAVILTLVGIKMLIADFYEVPEVWSLGVVLLILTISIGVSLLHKREQAPATTAPITDASAPPQPATPTYQPPPVATDQRD